VLPVMLQLSFNIVAADHYQLHQTSADNSNSIFRLFLFCFLNTMIELKEHIVWIYVCVHNVASVYALCVCI